MKGLAALILTAAASGAALAQLKSDWETKNEELLWREERVSLPAYPAAERLIEVDTGSTSDFRFFIDPGTLAVGQDGVVRYALVARSPSGTDNVRFEGIRCATGEYRVYAVGRPDGTWSARASEWRPYERGARSWHSALSRTYFCPHRAPIESAQAAIAALKQGGHPAARFEFR